MREDRWMARRRGGDWGKLKRSLVISIQFSRWSPRRNVGPVTPDFRIVQDKTVMRISRENHQCGYCQVSAVLRNRERGSRCGAPGWAAALEPQDAGSIRARQSGFRELHTPPGGGGGGGKRKQTKKKPKKHPQRGPAGPQLTTQASDYFLGSTSPV